MTLFRHSRSGLRVLAYAAALAAGFAGSPAATEAPPPGLSSAELMRLAPGWHAGDPTESAAGSLLDPAARYRRVLEADGRLLEELRWRHQGLLACQDGSSPARAAALGHLAAAERLSLHLQTNPYQYIVDFRDPSYRVEVDPYPALDYRDAFTFAVWLYLVGDARVPHTKVLSHAGVNPGKVTLMLSEDHPAVVLQVGEGRQLAYEGPDTIGAHRWTHLAIRFDVQRGCELFVDGEPRQLVLTSGSGVAPIVSKPDQVLYIGGLDRCFPGRLDDARIYARALSAHELQALARGEDVSAGLVGHWPLDVVEGNTTANRVEPRAPGRVGTAVMTGRPGVPRLTGTCFNFSGKHEVWTRRLHQLQAEVDSTELALVATLAHGEEEGDALAVLREHLRRTGARLVHYLRDGERQRWWAFVLDPEAASFVQRIDLGPTTRVAEAVSRTRSELQPSTFLGSSDEGSYREAARALARIVWDPVDGALVPSVPERTQTWLRLDGELHEVPFAALVDEHGRYLVERYAFARTGPVTALWREPSGHANSTAIAFGDPDFSARPGQERPRPWDTRDVASQPPAPRRSGPSGCRVLAELLYGTHVELMKLSRVFETRGRAPLRVFEWENAYESKLKRNVAGAAVLHVASHGYTLDPGCLPVEPRSLFETTGIQLGGVNALRADDQEHFDDGTLSAAEVSRLDLRACELVVFSGCATAGGSEVAGEGVFGLNTAAWIAGAGASVGALWSVNDDSVPLWMVDFYAAWLDGASPAHALQRAHLQAMDRTRVDRGHTHPFYWAAFVVAGL